jgi:hypothetical protein
MSRGRSEKTDQEWGPFHEELAIHTGHRSHEQRQHHRHQHPSAPLVARHQFGFVVVLSLALLPSSVAFLS